MREEKKLLLKDIKDQIDEYGSFLIMSYTKFNANAANTFRGEIAKLGGDVEMVPKRVLKKAAEAAGISLASIELPGHISLVLAGAEPFETVKAVFKYSKESGDAFTVIGGKFEGQLYNGQDVELLSQLPSKDEMRSQFLGLLEAPMAQTLSTMEAILCSVIYAIEEKTKKDGAVQGS